MCGWYAYREAFVEKNDDLRGRYSIDNTKLRPRTKPDGQNVAPRNSHSQETRPAQPGLRTGTPPRNPTDP